MSEVEVEERDVIEFDVLIVGAGPAGLATAIRLKQLRDDLNVCVIDKASTIGAQILSGAVMEPQPLDELLPGWRDNPPPICQPVVKDQFSLLTEKGRYWMPNPPQMNNHGNFIISLGATCAWLAEHAEEAGVEIYPGFSAAAPLFDETGERVIGVSIGDMGIDKAGNPKDGYMQGVDIHAQITVLAEGCRGSVGKALIAKYDLDKEVDPQTYGIGIKELWQVPEGRVTPGVVQHTIGWPMDTSTYGGSFLYQLDEDRIALGFVVGLDYQDPLFEPFEAFQQFKNHPTVKPLLEGGTIISSGARAIVEGGIQSLPKLEMPGALLVGDAGGKLNVPKIKGTHMALRSGMMAAEHLTNELVSTGFDQRWRSSSSADELHKVRNIRPGFHKGMWVGLINGALETVTLGKLPWTLRNHNDHDQLRKISEPRLSPAYDSSARTLEPRDRLASVYFAATEHDEDQPVHLQVTDTNICVTRCKEEYDNPCTRFCPANVYEMVEEEGQTRLQINSANCVHCKTCDIKDPYQIITWTTPEGSAGPNYVNL